MSNFVKILSLLDEMSNQSEIYSLYVLKNLIGNKDVCDNIKQYFPTNDSNLDNLKRSASECERITGNKLSKEFLNEDNYPDLALSILNKIFTSDNENEMLKFLMDYKSKNKITEITIKDLYDKFHSNFPN